ncbi:SseB family protein [Streptomyces bungoensis]|uniref:SseB family protein n=1 Tax=Streptomyces bungoensis TaxID=285568 RepID=UPI003404F182
MHQPVTVAAPQEGAEARRRRFTGALATFRDTSVLVPVRDDGWLTADFGGIRWILAFSDKSALARYALEQDEGHAEWTYQSVSGARLLDVAAPAAQVPCGVALDAADGAERALLLPPVAGIVPDAYAVNKGYTSDAIVIGTEEPE